VAVTGRDGAAVEHRAREDRTTAEELRAKLTQVRWEAAQERAALRQEARKQLDAILARLSATPDPDTGTSAPPAHEDQVEETERHG
jgi:hypothetical protein